MWNWLLIGAIKILFPNLFVGVLNQVCAHLVSKLAYESWLGYLN